MKDLKQKTIQGGLARLLAQGANFALRVGSLMILARLLGPEDYGLVGMVAAFTGVLSLFRDFGLSSAAIQRAEVTEEQISTLFWINLLVGVLLTLLTVAMAPAIAAFYHQPRLVAVSAVMALGFLFNAGGIQHSVLLQRQMRFTTMAVISTVSLAVGTIVGIAGAKAGYGYWALVAMTITSPFVATIGFWMAAAWIPGRPRRRAGIRSMMHFGGALTLNSLLAYLAYNAEKILIGRYWGADAIGIYGRAYQLINIPTDNLNTAIGEVAFSALSRLQHDLERLKSYFLKGYSLVLGLTIPITIACALFPDDIIRVLLGSKWVEAAPIFRLLAPTILIFGIINPLGWLLFSLGMVGRSLRMALVFTPLIIAGYACGLPYGPKGVALAYSAVMAVWAIPLIAWAVHGTVISIWDILLTVSKPLASAILAGGVTFRLRLAYGHLLSPLPRLVLESAVLLVLFAVVLLFVAGQKSFYLDLLRGLKASSALEEKRNVLSA
jgi:O-antigen/teichoic acid export membrane protein